jgi:hypothetical protein
MSTLGGGPANPVGPHFLGASLPNGRSMVSADAPFMERIGTSGTGFSLGLSYACGALSVNRARALSGAPAGVSRLPDDSTTGSVDLRRPVPKVEPNAGANADASVPPQKYVLNHPLAVDGISAPCLPARASGRGLMSNEWQVRLRELRRYC